MDAPVVFNEGRQTLTIEVLMIDDFKDVIQLRYCNKTVIVLIDISNQSKELDELGLTFLN